jgi:hypothetical protein
MDKSWNLNDPARNEFGNLRGTPRERKGAALGRRPCVLLLLFFPSFLPAALSRQSFLHAPLFTGFQIEGVALHFLDDVLLLDLALEAAQGILEGFSLLQSDFRQNNHTPRLVLVRPDSYCKVRRSKSSVICEIMPSFSNQSATTHRLRALVESETIQPNSYRWATVKRRSASVFWRGGGLPAVAEKSGSNAT